MSVQMANWSLAVWKFAERRTTRRVVALSLGMITLVIGVPVALGMIGSVSYRARQYGLAQTTWRLSGVVAWYDRDVPQNNVGLAYYQEQQLTPAVDRFESALKLAAPQRACDIRWNLGVALNHRGDDRAANQQPLDAIGDYTRAVNVLDVSPCSDSSSFRDLIDSTQRKLDALLKQMQEEHERPKSDEDNDTKRSDTNEDVDQQRADDTRKNRLDYNRSGRYDDAQEYQKEHETEFGDVAW